MADINGIYKLEPIMDNPKYEGFGMGDLPSLTGQQCRYDDLNHTFDSITGGWVPPRLQATWEPIRVLGRVRPYNDFPSMGLSYPVFSQRAVDVLRDILEANGELLPLTSTVGSYFLYNCTTIADIIDLQRSKVDFLNKFTILEIDNMQVYEDRLNGLSIFQIKSYPGRCFVVDSVAHRIREAKLEGIELRKIWPLPKNVPYWLYRKHPECHDKYTAQPVVEVRPIKGNAVVLRLFLVGENPTDEEKLKFEEIADQLDAILVNPRRRAKYYGNLEITEFVAGEARYFFSCPDADDLAKKLKPWVRELDWPGQKSLVKRYGAFGDAKATEELVKL